MAAVIDFCERGDDSALSISFRLPCAVAEIMEYSTKFHPSIFLYSSIPSSTSLFLQTKLDTDEANTKALTDQARHDEIAIGSGQSVTR